MKNHNFLSILIVLLIFVSCSHAQKNYDYMNSSEYRNKSQLTESLIGPNESLSEANIQKILNSKVVLPKKINLAILRLSDSDNSLQTIDGDMSEQFYQQKNWGNRIQSIIPFPQVMLAKPITLNGLRQAAVFLQADALLIIKPVSQSDWKMQWFDASKAKSQSYLEVLLLDTRTNIVPFTSLIREEVEISAIESDYDHRELLLRAKAESEKKALLQIPMAIQKFLSTIL